MKSKLHQIFSCSLTVHEYNRLVLFKKKSGRFSWTHTLSMLTYLSYCVIVSNDSLPGIQNRVFFLALTDKNCLPATMFCIQTISGRSFK